MADRFHPGDVKTVTQTSATGESEIVQVTILTQETPGMYRCQTNRGYSILVPEDALG